MERNYEIINRRKLRVDEIIDSEGNIRRPYTYVVSYSKDVPDVGVVRPMMSVIPAIPKIEVSKPKEDKEYENLSAEDYIAYHNFMNTYGHITENNFKGISGLFRLSMISLIIIGTLFLIKPYILTILNL